MVGIGKRLKELRVELRLNQGEFAQRLKFSQGAYSDYENGKKTLADKYIRLICLEFGVNEHWLKTGEGKMLVLPEPAPEPIVGPDGEVLEGDEAELLRIFRKLEQITKDKMLEYAKDLTKAQKFDAQTGSEVQRPDPDQAISV